MWRFISSAAVAVTVATPAWAQTSDYGYGEPLRSMDIQVCSQASGSPECIGVADWGIAGRYELTTVSKSQPNTIGDTDVDAANWQPDAGRGTTDSGDNRSGLAAGIGSDDSPDADVGDAESGGGTASTAGTDDEETGGGTSAPSGGTSGSTGDAVTGPTS